jgi:hypothetical protein
METTKEVKYPVWHAENAGACSCSKVVHYAAIWQRAYLILPCPPFIFLFRFFFSYLTHPLSGAGKYVIYFLFILSFTFSAFAH